MKIKGILITPNKKETEPRIYELEVNSYKDYYPLLECDTFDIQSRKFGDKYFDIYCDDEGLFKENNNPSILTYDGNILVEKIVGNVFIVNHDGEGKTISLTKKELQQVLNQVRNVLKVGTNEKYTVCVCEI